MLGHGGLAAYINDPRAGAGCSRGPATGGQGQRQQQQQLGDNDVDTANCLLLREYGNDWWSSQEDWLEMLKMYNISPDAVLHGR
ncbi:hypothetical protein PLESTM_000559700 [Pleodorina starrii]|nr:hypothetical protein PLESTM_000559700 [Pleodorina starrii]